MTQLANSDLAVVVRWLITFTALILGGYLTYRSRSNKILAEELEITRNKSERLETENKTLLEENASVKGKLAECEAKTDLTEIHAKGQKMQEIILQRFDEIKELLRERKS